MDERQFIQGYVDNWLVGRKAARHKELQHAYRKGKQLHDELFKGADKSYIGFMAEVPNEFDYEDE